LLLDVQPIGDAPELDDAAVADAGEVQARDGKGLAGGGEAPFRPLVLR
jgi:hypothetical protein